MKNFSDKQMGIALVSFSAFVFSTMGIFVKAIDVPSWDIIFYRGVFAIAFTTAFIAWRKQLVPEFGKMGMAGIVIAALFASGTAAFIPAFKLTSVANVALIYAAVPIIAGVLAWLVIGERLNRIQVGAIMVSFVGVIIIFQGSVTKADLLGTIYATWMTTALAIGMVLYRVFPKTPSMGPAALSSPMLIVPAFYFGAPELVGLKDIGYLMAFGLVFAVASVALMEGARRIPAAQAALLSILETPLGPLLAFTLLAEVPAMATILGGSLIFLAVLATLFFE